MQSVLAVIPARGGSKGLPGKNIKPLNGKPLIAWTIEAALHAACISKCVVSSDDAAILTVAREWGALAPFIRPALLSGDAAASRDVVIHALDFFESAGERFDAVILLQPTSPLRTCADIDYAFRLFCSSGCPACISVTACDHPPHWSCALDQQGRLDPLFPEMDAARRQDIPDYYMPNGAIYIARPDWLRESLTFLKKNTAAFIMPRERSVDIDSAFDFFIAEALATQRIFISAEQV